MMHKAAGAGKNFYESLDSGEQFRELPVYMGNEYQNHTDINASSYNQTFTQNNTIRRDNNNRTSGGANGISTFNEFDI